MFPEAFRSAPGEADYDGLQNKINSAQLKRIDLGEESIFYENDSDLEMIMPAYTFETGKNAYITLSSEGYYSPEHKTIERKGWLSKVLERK